MVGPTILRVGYFLPFPVRAWFNSHHVIERELIRQKVSYKKQDNRFLWVEDPKALQAAADPLDGALLQQDIDY